MDPQQLLTQLAPLREPTPIPWWPPAPGWWLLAAVVLALLLAAAVWAWRRHRQRRYRRLALATLEQLHNSGQASLGELNALLKATALRTFSGTEVASLHGEAWLAFLCQSAPKLERADINALAAVYREPDAAADAALVDTCRRWIRQHRRSRA